MANALGEITHFFLLDTPYAHSGTTISQGIASKLNKCAPTALVVVSKMIGTLLEQQKAISEN